MKSWKDILERKRSSCSEQPICKSRAAHGKYLQQLQCCVLTHVARVLPSVTHFLLPAKSFKANFSKASKCLRSPNPFESRWDRSLSHSGTFENCTLRPQFKHVLKPIPLSKALRERISRVSTGFRCRSPMGLMHLNPFGTLENLLLKYMLKFKPVLQTVGLKHLPKVKHVLWCFTADGWSESGS